MKTPDILLDMDSEKFDTINRYFTEELTEKNLRDALMDTRKQFGGISLQRVALIIRERFDEAEVASLVSELTNTR